jgi:16S rRNA (guanine527-N7)-methyltransferase
MDRGMGGRDAIAGGGHAANAAGGRSGRSPGASRCGAGSAARQDGGPAPPRAPVAMPVRRAEPPLAAERACALLHVSRETGARLAAYLDLLRLWQRRINLVGPATLADPWRRHILDSGQLWRLWPTGARILVDLGSGAGLPGLVLAIMGAPEAHLIESDRRKAAFLREAGRATGTALTVHACRGEVAAAPRADVLTARALAPLPRLLDLAARFLDERTTCLLLKGRGVETELTAARRGWKMRAAMHASLSDPSGRVLVLREVTRA